MAALGAMALCWSEVLHRAAEERGTAAVRALLRRRARETHGAEADARDARGRTALMVAVARNDAEAEVSAKE